MEYAIVDIETTGGYAAGGGITEIAIRIHDGTSVIDRYETLINPGRPIPLYIQAMTGITPEMVWESPAFKDVAARVYNLLQGRVFVAHNVNFDYSFVKHQLRDAGYDFTAKKLCTVRLTRKIKPGLLSYSLGRLCDALSIRLDNRHRAGGDADATAILFSRLIEWDTDGHITAMLKAASKEQQLPPNVPKADFERLPNAPGVYYFLNWSSKVMYVGKAINIKKRVAAHFTGHNPNPQRQHFMRDVYTIAYEKCGTELMALIWECLEIKRVWPQYNRALKRFEPKYGLYQYEDQAGYLRLAVGRLTKQSLCVQAYDRIEDAVRQLHRLIDTYELEGSLCLFPTQAYPGTKAIRQPKDRPDKEAYNERVRRALTELFEQESSFALFDKGRHEGEQSCIWMEKGRFYGMGYIDTDLAATTPAEIKERLSPYPGNHYITQLVYAHAANHPHKVMRF